MKRLISIILALIISLYNFHVPVVALTIPNDTSQYFMDDYYENIHHRYHHFMDEPGGWDSLSHDEIYVYNKWVDVLKNNKLFHAELDAVHFLTDASWSDIFFGSYDADDVKVQYYVSALSSLLMTMEDNLSDARTSQAKATSSMTWRDYAVETGLLVTGYLSQFAGGKNWQEAFETCGISLDILNSTVNTLEHYEVLQLNVDTYLSYHTFLKIMLNNNFDPLLAKAAEYLIKSLDQCFNYRMVHFSEFADIAIEAQSNQFFNVLDKVIDEVGEDAFESGEWAALFVLNKTASGLGFFKLGVDFGKWAGDIFFGSSNHIQRYYEMCAMSSARNAMIQEIKRQDANISGVSDVEKIPTICNLMLNLLYINLRGAYCAYRIQTQDVGLFSIVNVIINGKDINEWFDDVQSICNSLKLHLELLIPNVDDFQLTDEDMNDYDWTKEYNWVIDPIYNYNDIQILKCVYEQPYGQASLAKITRSDLYANENIYESVKELKGLYVVLNENGKKQLIDFNGKKVIDDYYDKIFVVEYYNIDTHEHSYFIEVQKDGRSNWIDENFNLINIALQGLGGIFDDNYYYNIDDSSVWLESFMEYERANMSELSSISVPIESVKVVQGERKYDTEIRTDLPGTGKFGLISYGNITVPMEYDGYYRLRNHFYYYDAKYVFSEDGRIVFYKDNKIYVFDENGKCYSEGKYDVAENANQEKYYYQGYLPVSLDGRWGYIDIYGNEVISCQFEDVASVYDGKAWVKKGGKWGVIELTNGYIEETPSTKMPYEEVAEPVTTDKGVIAPHLEKAPSGFIPIYTADELSKIQTHSFAQYILMNDIDLSNWGNWIPIGTSDFTGFSGVFDGNGYNILNINVDISKNGENAYGGLFAKCHGGEIRNLGIVGGKISVKSYGYNMIAGGIAGYCTLDTKISNCFNTATIMATSLGNNGTSMNNYARIGGIIGDGDAIIENCFNTGNLTASDAYAISYVGGIVGTFSNSSMKNVYNTGNLKSSAHYGSKYDNIGGLIGYEGNSNELINCYYLDTAANPIGYAFTKDLSETVKELTSSEIKLQSAFIGFDFDNIWAISEDINNSYPYLKTVNFISIAPTENVSENR